MDELFGTNEHFNQAWQSTVDQNYVGPDYPVDKILASCTPTAASAAQPAKALKAACQA